MGSIGSRLNRRAPHRDAALPFVLRTNAGRLTRSMRIGSGSFHASRLASLRLLDRLELVDSAVHLQRQEQMTVPDDVRGDVAPLPDDLIVQRTRRALRARQCQRTELDLAGAR